MNGKPAWAIVYMRLARMGLAVVDASKDDKMKLKLPHDSSSRTRPAAPVECHAVAPAGRNSTGQACEGSQVMIKEYLIQS